jgi:hypothetical protein
MAAYEPVPVGSMNPSNIGASRPYLFRLHAVASILQLAAVAAMISLASDVASVDVVTHLPRTNTTGIARPSMSRSVGTVNLAFPSIAFLGLSSFQHLLLVLPLRDWYTQQIDARRNPLRWIEYSISASIMHMHISILCGVSDLHLLFAIASLTTTTMMFGLASEWYQSRGLFWGGFVPHLGQWLIAGCYFFFSVTRSPNVPNFVWSIFFGLTLFDLSFAVLTGLGLYGVGRFKSFASVEVGFIVLSLTSKQFLAWMTFYGSKARD